MKKPIIIWGGSGSFLIILKLHSRPQALMEDLLTKCPRFFKLVNFLMITSGLYNVSRLQCEAS